MGLPPTLPRLPSARALPQDFGVTKTRFCLGANERTKSSTLSRRAAFFASHCFKGQSGSMPASMAELPCRTGVKVAPAVCRAFACRVRTNIALKSGNGKMVPTRTWTKPRSGQLAGSHRNAAKECDLSLTTGQASDFSPNFFSRSDNQFQLSPLVQFSQSVALFR